MNRTMPPLLPRLARIAAAGVDLSSYKLLASRLRHNLEEPAIPASACLQAASDETLLALEKIEGIPKIVFQTWKSKKTMPSNYAYWRNTFVSHNPDHLVLLWDDDDNRAFIARHFDWFLQQYDAYALEIFRADIVRPFFLFRYGGFYADMDCECLRPIADMKVGGDIVLGRMGADPSFEHSIPNAIMASRPRQGLWLAMIAMAIDRFQTSPKLGPEHLTGPILLRHTILLQKTAAGREHLRNLIARHIPSDLRAQAIDGRIEIVQPSSMYPVNWNNPAHQIFRRNLLRSRRVLPSKVAATLFPRASIVTYWSHSW